MKKTLNEFWLSIGDYLHLYAIRTGAVKHMIVQNYLTGDSKGKFGNSVFYKSLDQNMVRAVSENWHDAKSPEQLDKRARFAELNLWAKRFNNMIKIGYCGNTGNQVAYNKFMSFNLKNAMTGDGKPTYIDYSKVLIAKGLLSVMVPVSFLIDPDENFVELIWTDNSYEQTANPSDYCRVLLYNITQDKFAFYLGDVKRRITTVTFSCPDGFLTKDNKLIIYSFFVSETGKRVSNSRFWGEFILS